MLSQPPIWMAVLAFVLAIGPLVFFHELGHYFVARLFGIGAETFSIGFGREIVGWTDKRGTRWKVGWLPLGGYVRFVGDMNAASQADSNAVLTAEQRAVAFHNRPVWQRFLVVLAGPVANFLLAIAIFAAFLGIYGAPRTPTVAEMIAPGSAAEQAGIRPGDRIDTINGSAMRSFEDIFQYVLLRPGEKVDIRLNRAGRPMAIKATLGDKLQSDGYGEQHRIGQLGIANSRRVLTPISPAEAVPEAVRMTWRMTGSMVEGLRQIVVGERSVKELGGPVKMAKVAGQQANMGAIDLVWLIAFFSINLGFINLLPVPMLDGGHLAMYAVEAVRRRPLDAAAQEWAFRGGFALLMTLFLFLTVNDLASLGLAERLGRLIG